MCFDQQNALVNQQKFEGKQVNVFVKSSVDENNCLLVVDTIATVPTLPLFVHLFRCLIKSVLLLVLSHLIGP